MIKGCNGQKQIDNLKPGSRMGLLYQKDQVRFLYPGPPLY